jgi:pimeloyl-ACP methyl ester carboxylesterase
MRSAFLAGGLCFAVAAAGAAAAQTPAFEAQPCADPAIREVARCGIVQVPENRGEPGGRQIALNVVVLPATGPKRLPALFDLEGGPGLPATTHVGFYLDFGGAYRRERDIVLFDQRGTGRSSPLTCPELASPDRQYQPLYPVELVAACRTALSERAELEHYGTDAAADDLDSVRQALGHERIDIFGLSYGTLLGLRYDQRFPGRVRAMVLFGTVTPEARVPSGHAPAGERALDGLIGTCAAEAACAERFPSIRADLDRALDRLEGIEGAPERDLFLERLRSLMYAPSGARMIPLIAQSAAAGDLGPFFAATRRRQAALDSDGVYLSIICSEGMAGLDYEPAAELARRTIFGDYRLRRQRAACEGWPIAATAPDFFDPPRPTAALLLVSGELDPVTPPDWAEAVARRAAVARHIVLPGGGHIIDGLSAIDTCLDPLLIAFLDHGDPQALDTSCLDEVRAPPFATSLPPAPDRP